MSKPTVSPAPDSKTDIEEGTVFAPRFDNGMLTEEVTQTTVNFTAHKLVAPSQTEQQVRLEVGKRIMLRLALFAKCLPVSIEQG